MEEPGGLQSMGSLSWTRLSNFTFTFHFHALEKEMATHSVFLPGESQGRGSLVGFHLWGHAESDTTEAFQQQMGKQWLTLFLGAPESLQMVIAAMKFKRPLFLLREAMTNLDSICKSRDITLSTKVHLVKVMVFPVVMYGCESWTIKKAEHLRIDAFELWCWGRLLRIPWTARRSN